MCNGTGDEYSIVFSPAGAYVRVFDHESSMSPWRDRESPRPWPGLLEPVPEVFRPYTRNQRSGWRACPW